MRKILISILTIGAVSALLVGGTMSFFSDTEVSSGNSFTAGTIEIAVDDQLHWSQSFNWEDVKPGREFEISFNITNEGMNPLKLWQITKCLVTDENGVIEPEQDWYDDNGVIEKNDIDSAIVYEMYVDGNLAVAKEAGITMDKIKDAYLGLVKLDQPFEEDNGDGILYPGESVLVEQKYFMKSDTENWAQSDMMTFVIEIEARQIDAPEPLQQMSFMDNKFVSGDWHVIADEQMGILKYDYMAPTFNYDFYGVGLNSGMEYCLIYYADPWSSQGSGLTGQTGFLIDQGVASSSGEITLSDNSNINTNLPNIDDGNYPYGAKIWLLPCSQYNISDHKLIGWDPNNLDWLFDNWPGLINYRQGDRPDEEIQCEDNEGENNNHQIIFSDLNVDPQFAYSYDYDQADVVFNYKSPTVDKLQGTIVASGLKPNVTYQVKFIGKPSCHYTYGSSQEDQDADDANEYIGYNGRWTCLDCSCSGATCNRSDTQYESNTSECIAGYLVWDFFTADENGNITKDLSTDNSFHVLYCNGGVCGGGNGSLNNSDCSGTSPAYPYCDANDVGGQLERPTTIPCDGLVLDDGIYNLEVVLTEESFHTSCASTWTTVMDSDINFEIQ